MRPGDDSRLWIVAGALGGLALGLMLIPLRSLTSASNLAFVFNEARTLTIAASILGLELTRRQARQPKSP